MLSILQVHAIRFMADMRAELFVRSHGLFSYEFLNRALFCLNKANVSSEAAVPEFAICDRSFIQSSLPRSIRAINNSIIVLQKHSCVAN